MVIYLAGLMLWNRTFRHCARGAGFSSNLTAKIGLRQTGSRRSAIRLRGFWGRRPAGATGSTGAGQQLPQFPRTSEERQENINSGSGVRLAPGAIPEVRIHDDRNPISTYVVASLGTLYEFVLMSSFMPFLVYFMLSWRDHIYKSFLRFFEGADRLVVARSVSGVPPWLARLWWAISLSALFSRC